MAKQILFGEEARKSLKKGVDTLSEAIRVTLWAAWAPRSIRQEMGCANGYQ